MAYGLQVFDSSGNITLDTSDRILNLHGKVTGSVYVGTTAYLMWTIPVPGIQPDGFWFIYPVDLIINTGNPQLTTWLLVTDSYVIEPNQIKIISYGWIGRTVNAAFEVYKR